MNGANAKCLIDTGSVISTISEFFVVTFLKQVQIKELENLLENFTFESASGSDMDFIGYVETVIHIPNIGKYDVVLLVVKDTEFSREVPILVGTNILRNLPQHKRVNTLWRTNIKQCHHLINKIGKVYGEIQVVHPNSEVTLL